ncbi:hypothetical protein GmHk_16G047143 [Glycine max]|nr:hypothetical protein GmHk_16G047143 [Glycine max]
MLSPFLLFRIQKRKNNSSSSTTTITITTFSPSTASTTTTTRHLRCYLGASPPSLRLLLLPVPPRRPPLQSRHPHLPRCRRRRFGENQRRCRRHGRSDREAVRRPQRRRHFGGIKPRLPSAWCLRSPCHLTPTLTNNSSLSFLTMANPISETEIPDETLSPNAIPDPNQDQDSTMQAPIPTILTVIDDDPEPDSSTGAATCGGGTTTRRTTKRKKGPKRTALERRSRKKLQVIVTTLNPIPFTPAKTLDFERHQSLLRRLGLWYFVHVEFDSALRGDLLAQLITSYVPTNRCSYVNGVRINVNRADLGRTLKLPVKKTGCGGGATADSIDSAESIAFAEEVVYSWMLLHDGYIRKPNLELLHTYN